MRIYNIWKEVLRETTKTLSKVIRSSGRYLKLGTPRYEAGVVGLIKGDKISY
jgi:hypothetical protein